MSQLTTFYVLNNAGIAEAQADENDIDDVSTSDFVEATYLNINGNNIVDPNVRPTTSLSYSLYIKNSDGTFALAPANEQNVNNYFVTPVSYDTGQPQSLVITLNLLNPTSSSDSIIPTYSDLTDDIAEGALFTYYYRPGGPEDIQRNYNNYTWNGDSGNFVPAFQDIGSFDLGYVADGVGYHDQTTELSAIILRAIESRPFPSDNIASIDAGIQQANLFYYGSESGGSFDLGSNSSNQMYADINVDGTSSGVLTATSYSSGEFLANYIQTLDSTGQVNETGSYQIADSGLIQSDATYYQSGQIIGDSISDSLINQTDLASGNTSYKADSSIIETLTSTSSSALPPSIIFKSSGTETFIAGSGNDTLFGGSAGHNVFYGNQTSSATTTDIMIGDGLNNTADGVETTTATAQQAGNDIFNIGYGNNIVIGGDGKNTFNFLPSGYQNGIDVLWGGGGVSNYNFTGVGASIAIVYMDNPTVQNIESLENSLSQIQAKYGEYYPGTTYVETYPTLIINPGKNDTISINGETLTGANYSSNFDTYAYSNYENGDFSYSRFYEPGWIAAAYKDDRADYLAGNSRSVSSLEFVNGDFGINLVGDGPENNGPNDTAEAVNPSWLSYNTKTYLSLSTLTASSGNETLNAGTGTNYVYEQGDENADVFDYNVGYGQQEINNTGSASSVLQLGAGITTSNLIVASVDSAGDIFLTDGTAGDQIEIDGEATNSADGVQSVHFSNGTTWTEAQLVALAQAVMPKAATISGTTAANTLTGTTGADVIDGKGGADTVTGNGGGDSLIYNPGYGVLTINETHAAGSAANVVSFGAGITQSEVTASTDAAADVVLAVNDGTAGDEVLLKSMLTTPSDGVQDVTFANGTVMPIATLAASSTGTLTQSNGDAIIGNSDTATVSGGSNLVQLGTNETLTLSGNTNTVNGGSDTNIISATGNENTINGGSGGANIVATGTGNDLYAGTDYAYLEADGDSNTVQAGAGTNTLVATGDNNVMLGGAGYALVTATGDGNSFTGSTNVNGNNDVTFTGDYNNLTGAAAGVNFLAIGDSNTLAAGTSFNTLETEGSDNTLQGGSGSTTLIASAGTDSTATATATGTGNVLTAGSGYTEIDVTGNANTLTGGTGTNSLTATGDNNVLTAGTSFADLSATGDANTLTGGSGVNTLSVSGDNNLLDSGAVYNEVDIAGNSNTFQAGAGNGDLTVDGNNNQVTGSNNAYWSAEINGTDNVVTAGENTVGVTADALGNTYSAGTGYMIVDYSYVSGDVTVNLASGTASVTGSTATDHLASSVSEVHVGFNSAITAGTNAALLEATGNGDTLTGGAGDDDLIADGIYDTMSGGAGENTLVASEANNIFKFDGTGSDIIMNGSATGTAAVNQMQFINSVTDQKLWLERSGNDLDIVQIGTSNTVDLQNWYSGSQYQLQSFQDANGLTLSNSSVSTLVAAMATYQSAHTSFNAASASVMPTDTTLQNAITAAWHS